MRKMISMTMSNIFLILPAGGHGDPYPSRFFKPVRRVGRYLSARMSRNPQT